MGVKNYTVLWSQHRFDDSIHGRSTQVLCIHTITAILQMLCRLVDRITGRLVALADSNQSLEVLLHLCLAGC